MLAHFLFSCMSLNTLPAFPFLKPCILSWHLLTFVPSLCLPNHSLALHPGLLNFVLPLHLPFFSLRSHAWHNLFPCPSYCCIPVHIRFVIFLLLQLYITSLRHFLSFTVLLTFCCSHILPTLTTLLHSNIPLWSSDRPDPWQQIWSYFGPGLQSSPAACGRMDPLPKQEGAAEATSQAAPHPAQSEQRGHQESPYHFPPGSRSFFIHLRNYPVTPCAVLWLAHSLPGQEG